MDPRENALRILSFDQPERVITRLPALRLSYQGCNHETYDGTGGDDSPVGSRWTDIWGTEWLKIHDGVMGMPQRCPLAETASLARYRWPDPDDPCICAKVYQQAASYSGGERLLVGSHRDTLWEKAYMLVGMEKMMILFLREPNFAREVLQRIMDFQIGIAQHYLAVGIDLAQMGDDLGAQNGPLLSPRIVDEFLVPQYQRLIQLYRDHHVRIGFHCCGNLDGVLDTLLDLGIDLLDPVQATANDLERVRAATQGRMALQGGVSSATVMEGPIKRIVHEVQHRLWQLGRDGGYVCAPDQGMPYPDAHLQALEQAVNAYGRYPIQPPDID